MKKNTIVIGTRGSKLALIQTEEVKGLILKQHPDLSVEIKIIKTSGDWDPKQGETRLSEADGGKGLFAKEIEQALIDEKIDLGVHSMKDMASFLPEELSIEHMLIREDPRDAFISNDFDSLDDLPENAVVGTSSLRRQAFLLAKRPDLKVVPLRGNVPTRLKKMDEGQVQATVLALSGLKRLGLEGRVASIIEVDEMLPAAGQGAIGLEIRKQDEWIKTRLDPLHCKNTGVCVGAERAVLKTLDGSCQTPIGAYANLDGNQLDLKAIVASSDGAALYEKSVEKDVSSICDAIETGEELGKELLEIVPSDLLAA
jgi:hydroxymethylbilane synthase